MKKILLSLVTTLILGIASCTSMGKAPTQSLSPQLSSTSYQKIGHQIWKNECAGSVEGLTSWNKGEAFPSLGIGHFIWYPEGKKGIFQESFPALISYAKKQGAQPPSWTKGPCPWDSRQSFLTDLQTPRLKELRSWLQKTTALQTQFIVHERCIPSLKKIVTQSSSPSTMTRKVNALLQSPEGTYALIDYVNFKGEGFNPSERYKGEGWGLTQVLQTMDNNVSVSSAPIAFSSAAKKVLTRRVENSPNKTQEQKWLPGWINRCSTYAKPF